MSDSLNNEQLLTAYFDNELGPEERRQAELILAENPDQAQVLQQWRENGNALRELPRYSLGDGFAAGVLASTEDHSDQPNTETTLAKVDHDAGIEWQQTTNSRIGFAAIATLAAMLLLTLFVFPAMTDSNNVAVNQPDPSGTGAVVDSEGTNRVDPKSNGNLNNHQPVIGTRNSSLPGTGKNGRPVDPIVLTRFSGPSVEQVLWVEINTLADLESVLANHSIKIVDPDNDIQGQAHLVPHSSDGVEAVYVVSSVARMKLAIADMSSELTCSVKAFPLPGASSASIDLITDKSRVENASAQQIKPIDLSRKGADANEIASLDKWFGLVDDEDESRMIHFLLLVNTPPEATTDSSKDSPIPAPSDRR